MDNQNTTIPDKSTDCCIFPVYVLCFGINIEFSLGIQAALMGLHTAISTAFGLFMASVLDRNISV
ncbi:hypothetical protein [Bacillus sp. 03113]|uniref:hypothetical protein n=1 Tax=Bacillus sp. 03113 TaxID=2578211 RepID=UPI0015E8C383|nr:hypothetical protein [Bacillus sp. 03113]